MNKNISNLLTLFISIICYKLKITRLPYPPIALWIEPTNKCNLKCVMCPNSIIPQEKLGFMDFKLYKKIINQSKNYLSYIVLCISGESLLHPQLPQMIAYAKKNQIKTYLSTNATVLTPTLSKKLIKSGLDWINFSFDGCSPEVYENIRINANFNKTLNNVIDFLKIKKELDSPISTELQIIILNEKGLKDYQKNIKKFKNKFINLPLNHIQIRSPSTWGNIFFNTNKFVPKKLSRIFSPCSYLWCSLGVLWDGRIVACCSDFFGKNTFGNIKKESLKLIWNSQKIIHFRQSMIKQSYSKYNDYCQNCDSLWEKRILGLPAGIRGVTAVSFSNIFGKNFLGLFKKMAKKINQDFAMKIIDK
jgi:radical SAM protein with 4Fe4S-binding SPASM domain